MISFDSFKDNCGFGALVDIKGKDPTHKNLQTALLALCRMKHRGAISSDNLSGDGCGFLFSMPDEFIKKNAFSSGIILPKKFALAVIFLKNLKELDVFSNFCLKNDLRVILTRELKINKSVLGKQALKTLPKIFHVVVSPNSILSAQRFESVLYLTRKEVENRLRGSEDFHIASFSDKLISYKGLLMPENIGVFYEDLQDRSFKIKFAIFHQRFSTNTLPKWKLAQPLKSLAHNGEINSISSNIEGIEVKSNVFKSQVFSDEELKRIMPIILDSVGSDSSVLDNFFEFLIKNKVDFFKAIRSLIPPPWQNAPSIDSNLRAFYEHNASIFKVWDGPAAVVFTDGRYIACTVDRNGLRPAKYIQTKNGLFIIASEFGIVDIDEKNIVSRGKLSSGATIAIDTKLHKVINSSDIDEYIQNSFDYKDWVNRSMIHIEELSERSFTNLNCYNIEDIFLKQRYFNITQEVLNKVIEPMMNNSKESTSSMGDDTPISVFSKHQRPFNDFFRQKFSQVTNPPIDSIREKVIMSLNISLGEVTNILEEADKSEKKVKFASPIITYEQFMLLNILGDRSHDRYKPKFKNRIFYTNFKSDLKESLDRLVLNIVESVKKDSIRVVILSDEKIDENNMIMPMMMVVGRLNTTLTKKKIKHLVSIVCISSEIYDSHSVACLISFGASLIYPKLLYASVLKICLENELCDFSTSDILRNVLSALKVGLLKVMSKVGVSTISSYKDSCLFDIFGLSETVINDCFSSASYFIPALTYADIEKNIKKTHKKAYREAVINTNFPLEVGGFYSYGKNLESHAFSPLTVDLIQSISIMPKEDDFRRLNYELNRDRFTHIRDFFEFDSDRGPIDISKVEPVESIFKRFETAAMSLGSISKEAHETVAIAMNSIGGKSNSGEGGEERSRFKTDKNSRIKQVASGRFGVTADYLRSADEIQIKIAQGAKPGEGGQLSGNKVTQMIASLRYTKPGVTLISPPPHHDIYSIEDLAQLIFDLKQVNPFARVSVKLVSSSGIGTIAVGVAKSYADKIIVSGNDGGTGASSTGSIKYAGNPWEVGLSEVHNTLKVNSLRNLVSLQTDGGFKVGTDIVKASMLGAESYGFGTSVLVSIGCKILRVCHLNRCAFGIATQDKLLREKFVGTPQMIINYFTLLAQDVRKILSQIGYKSLQDIIGRVDLMRAEDSKFAKKFDFSYILTETKGVNFSTCSYNKPFDDNQFEKDILKDVRDVIDGNSSNIEIKKDVKNYNRSIGALISGEIASIYGNRGLEDDSIVIKLKGVPGQSLGAFLVKGVSLYLDGYANDYVGKGMSGGKIVISSKKQNVSFSSAGNVCLYGATGGKLFVAGLVGERFCVRNSGSFSVVEGAGDHACEYMTGGVVAILGKTGINFGAGMTGGLAFVYDEDNTFINKLNQELVIALRVDIDEMEEAKFYLKKILVEFVRETKSKKGIFLLDNFLEAVKKFWLVRPLDMLKAPLSPEEGN